MKKRDLPPRMHMKHGSYYYVRRGKWSHLGRRLDDAMERYARMEHGLSISETAVPSWATMDKYLIDCYWRAKKNARKRSIQFDLSTDQYRAVVSRANGRCEVTGIIFELTVRDGCERRPFAPSLDRINSAIGYQEGNCRLVCGMVNTAIGAWGDEVFWYMVKNARRRRPRELRH